MLYLILSILGSVSVGILLKISKRFKTDIKQMIIVNYMATVLLSYFYFKPSVWNIPNDLPVEIIIPLSVLLPLIFVTLYYSILYSGIIKTDLAQRMSLFIPILASIFLFKEQISNLRYIALLIGLLSIYFILNKERKKNILNEHKKAIIFFPISVFIGFGIIDIFFKKLALYSSIPYTSSLFYVFLCALIVSVLINLLLTLFKQSSFAISKYTVFFGLPLGILNFINILFYMKAHQIFANNPTTVFAGMNFGVILLGTAVGYFFFKERLTKQNLIGLAMAVIAVSLIVYTQL
ncbi:hypothetical protein C8P70_10314 [Myroides indicus]|uniref:EamA-like transporter family protein n=1 Tax=Myroides indicus TaxID=1323422 RepID=A0A4R7F5S9_9FLAO|nr:hypothetical protein C8P70_10314 [Myroides indicus]